MKKTSAEASEGSLPAARQSRTREDAGGKKIFRSVLYYLVLAVVLFAVIYFLTKINSNTYKVNI